MAPTKISDNFPDITGYTINNKYYLVRSLGSGASGVVYHALHTETHEQVAIKMVLKPTANNQDTTSTLSSSKKIFATPVPISYDGTYIKSLNPHPALYNEVLLHTAVHEHPNVLSVLEVLDAYKFLCVVLEYCEQGDLFTAITEKNWYVGNEIVAKALFLQLLDAVEYCHTRSVYHCDLKPENIMVSNDGTQLKIADFGLSSRSPLCSVFGRGSSYYMAPETIAENTVYRKRTSNAPKNHASRRCSDTTAAHFLGNIHRPSQKKPLQSNGYPKAAGDVWALGVVFLNLIFGRNPWKKASMVEDPAYQDYSMNYNTLKGILPVSEELNLIMSQVFHPDPYRRISISRLRYKILKCSALSNPSRHFSWYTKIADAQKKPVIIPQHVITAVDEFEIPPKSPSRNIKCKIGQEDTSSVLSDVTFVHIANSKTPSIEIVTRKSSRASQSKSLHARSPVLKPHIPALITPPLSKSVHDDCAGFSASSSSSSASSSASSHRKRKIDEQHPNCFGKLGHVHKYSITPEKSLISSAVVSNTKVMFHPNSTSLYLCNLASINTKRIKSTCLVQSL